MSDIMKIIKNMNGVLVAGTVEVAHELTPQDAKWLVDNRSMYAKPASEKSKGHVGVGVDFFTEHFSKDESEIFADYKIFNFDVDGYLIGGMDRLVAVANGNKPLKNVVFTVNDRIAFVENGYSLRKAVLNSRDLVSILTKRAYCDDVNEIIAFVISQSKNLDSKVCPFITRGSSGVSVAWNRRAMRVIGEISGRVDSMYNAITSLGMGVTVDKMCALACLMYIKKIDSSKAVAYALYNDWNRGVDDSMKNARQSWFNVFARRLENERVDRIYPPMFAASGKARYDGFIEE